MEQEIKDNKISIVKKKSQLHAKNNFDIKKLIYENEYFLPCTYEEDMEEVIFTYDISEKKPASMIKKEERKNQYQFLINFSKLENVFRKYEISLKPDNIYYDENFMPYVKERDLYEENGSVFENDFIYYYKSFIGGVLGINYDISSIQESGLEILKDEAGFEKYSLATDIKELVSELRKNKNIYEEKQKKRMILVSRQKYRVSSILSIAVPIIATICIGVLIYMGVKLIPFQNAVINSIEFYVQSDYVATINSMKEISIDDMDKVTKYILAVSYAKSESLKKEEMQNIVAKLSVNNNERELEYWIYLGRLDTQKAEDIAQSLSDDQLLIYAYMKELDQLKADTYMSGENKQFRISELENKITSLGDKYITDDNKDETNSETVIQE